jgi:pyrimidine operon attenuation protein / uracil phosphoribosyltransferase
MGRILAGLKGGAIQLTAGQRLIRKLFPSGHETSQRNEVGTAKSIGSADVKAAITRLAEAISTRHRSAKSLLLLGIANGGIELARRLAIRLSVLNAQRATRAGTIDISFHRDDIGHHPIPREFAPTQIPADVTGATVILVDDVLFSGRTVKAALDELFDHGRPKKVELAVLVDRGGHLLPVAADYVGLTLDVTPTEKIVVTLNTGNEKADRIVSIHQPSPSPLRI